MLTQRTGLYTFGQKWCNDLRSPYAPVAIFLHKQAFLNYPFHRDSVHSLTLPARALCLYVQVLTAKIGSLPTTRRNRRVRQMRGYPRRVHLVFNYMISLGVSGIRIAVGYERVIDIAPFGGVSSSKGSGRPIIFGGSVSPGGSPARPRACRQAGQQHAEALPTQYQALARLHANVLTSATTMA